MILFKVKKVEKAQGQPWVVSVLDWSGVGFGSVSGWFRDGFRIFLAIFWGCFCDVLRVV